MQIKIDTAADALYITLKKGAISRTENRGDYLVDYDEHGALLGFEVLNFSEKIPMNERNLTSIIDNRKTPLSA